MPEAEMNRGMWGTRVRSERVCVPLLLSFYFSLQKCFYLWNHMICTILISKCIYMVAKEKDCVYIFQYHIYICVSALMCTCMIQLEDQI